MAHPGFSVALSASMEPSRLLSRPSFIDTVEFNYEPFGPLGRYLLSAEQTLLDRGVRAFRASKEELVAINEANRDTWAKLMPVLDHRINEIADKDLITVAAVDIYGSIIATISVRRMDILSSVKEEMESLRFFYSAHAHEKSKTDSFLLTAESAAQLKGNLFYLGGLWVHPKHRHGALPVLLTRIVRYMGMAHWNPDAEIGIATNAFLRSDVAKIYAFEATEVGFSFEIDGKLAWRGVFVHSSREANLQNLRKDVAELDAQVSGASDDSRSNEQMFSAVSLKRNN
jgi:hypothetical protein